MSNKTYACYNAVFKYIEKEIFHLEAAEFMTDFEGGLRKALAKVYPNTQIRGCWFHYCKAIRKKSRALGLESLQKKNVNASMISKELMSLPLLPSEKFTEGFEQIKRLTEEHELVNEYKGLFEYFENYWLKQVMQFKIIFKNTFKIVSNPFGITF